MANWFTQGLQNFWPSVQAMKPALGETIDYYGKKLGNPLPEMGISEWLVKPAYASESTSKGPIYGPPYSGPQQQPIAQPQQKKSTPSGDGKPYPNPSNAWMDEQNRNWEEKNRQSSGPSQTQILDDRARGEISGGYDRYFSELDSMLGELPNQRTAQEGIVGSQYTQGVSDLGAEKTTGLADLGMQRTRTESNQAKNLADLADSIRNQFLTGQVMLGTRGAGDSSAANQYSYALTKLGSKARGDVMGKTADITSEIDNREFKLNTIFSNEKTKLGSNRDQKISEIAQWFSEATNEIRQMKASGQISKGQDLASLTQKALSYAMQQAQQTQTAYLNRQGMLEQWAANNATNINQLRQNMRDVASYRPNLPQFAGVQGQPTWDVGGNLSAPIGFGTSDEEKKQQGYYS